MFEFLKRLNRDKTAELYTKFIDMPYGIKRNCIKGKMIGEMIVKRRELLYTVDYVGGFPEQPKGSENVRVAVLPAGLVLSCGVVGDLIPWEEIKGVSLKTQEQVRRDVTLTRLVAFGWYALALKKRRVSTVTYTVLSCSRNGMNYNVVFGGNTGLYTYLFNALAEGLPQEVQAELQGVHLEVVK